MGSQHEHRWTDRIRAGERGRHRDAGGLARRAAPVPRHPAGRTPMTRPWRSELAVPGSNPRMIDKGIVSAADMVFLDLEDAVAAGEKTTAREAVVAALAGGEWSGKPRTFRVN